MIESENVGEEQNENYCHAQKNIDKNNAHIPHFQYNIIFRERGVLLTYLIFTLIQQQITLIYIYKKIWNDVK